VNQAGGGGLETGFDIISTATKRKRGKGEVPLELENRAAGKRGKDAGRSRYFHSPSPATAVPAEGGLKVGPSLEHRQRGGDRPRRLLLVGVENQYPMVRFKSNQKTSFCGGLHATGGGGENNLESY